MAEGKILIITNSVYQLLTAVHMKRSILVNERADLILTDIMPHPESYAQRLWTTGLFERVILAATKEFSGKYAVGSEAQISEGYQKAESILRWALSEEMDVYKQVYFSNYDTFTRMLACRYYETKCEFICFEDGFSTYVIDYLRDDRAAVNRHPEGGKIREMVKEVLLYEPQLAMRKDALPNRALPKIRLDDDELKGILNYIFDYQKPKMRADFLFLEQSFRAENIKTNDLELMRECRESVLGAAFFVKPHPRNAENLPYQMGLTGKYTDDTPWELFLLNEVPEDCTIITVCSNAALTGRLVFGMDIPTVMLYRLFEGRVLWKEDEILRKYLHKFRCQFAGEHYYVPETIYELRSTLRYLEKTRKEKTEKEMEQSMQGMEPNREIGGIFENGEAQAGGQHGK